MKNKDYRWTFEKFLERFEAIEKDLKLDESIIKGVPWWDKLRNELFIELLIELGLKKTFEKNETLNFWKFCQKKILNIIYVLKNLIKLFLPKSPLWIKKNTNLILGHPRRKFEKGLYVDIYTDPFIELFPKTFNFSVIERDEGNNHLSPTKTKSIYHGEIIYNIANIISKIRRIKFNKSEFQKISQLEKILYDEFSFQVDIKKKVKETIKNWLGYYPIMRLFFKFKKPKILFVVVSHSQEAIISAAKSLGITTVELQHGSPSRGKLNYDYTSGIKKNSFPEFFLSFGDYWSSNCKFPLNKNKIISFGYPYLYSKLNSYSNIMKEDRIIIVSQGTEILAKFAKDLGKYFSKKIIVEYKPHPKEFYENEPSYFTDLRDAGVVISDKKADLYEIFAKSRWQVGIYSTALFEGLYFGTACFILNTVGSERVKNLIELDLARLISKPNDIDLNWKVNLKETNKIFLKPNKKNLESFISLMK